MTINNEQIKVIEDLIARGEMTFNIALPGKKRYVEVAKSALRGIYKQSGEEFPSWLDSITPINIISQDGYNEKEYYNSILPLFLNMLRSMQSSYYSQKQLDESKKQTEESKKQTEEAFKQTEEAIKANKLQRRANWALFATVVIAIVSIFLSYCSGSH